MHAAEKPRPLLHPPLLPIERLRHLHIHRAQASLLRRGRRSTLATWHHDVEDHQRRAILERRQKVPHDARGGFVGVVVQDAAEEEQFAGEDELRLWGGEVVGGEGDFGFQGGGEGFLALRDDVREVLDDDGR